MSIVEKVAVKTIDTDRVEKDDSFPKAYAFYIVLSSTPDPIWVELFMSRYESSFYNLKREMTIHGRDIRVVTAPGDEARHVEFFRRLVEETNKAVDQHKREMASEEAGSRRVLDQQAEEAEEIRENLRKIHIG